jgi:L-glyceraldehyde reductase
VVGKPKLTENPVVIEIAEKLNATPAQVLVAWGAYRGYSVIPKSVQECKHILFFPLILFQAIRSHLMINYTARIISNFKQVELSAEDYEKITAIGVGNRTRYNIPHHYTPRWDISIFGEPEEATANNKTNIGA